MFLQYSDKTRIAPLRREIFPAFSEMISLKTLRTWVKKLSPYFWQKLNTAVLAMVSTGFPLEIALISLSKRILKPNLRVYFWEKNVRIKLRNYDLDKTSYSWGIFNEILPNLR